MSNRDIKLSLAWVTFSILMFFTGWISRKYLTDKYVAQTSPRFVSPHQKVNKEMEFNVGIECPQGYDMKFIALTPKEENEYEPKSGEGVFDQVHREEKRTNRLLNNAVCVKSEAIKKVE